VREPYDGVTPSGTIYRIHAASGLTIECCSATQVAALIRALA
jgi:hypothetical protein